MGDGRNNYPDINEGPIMCQEQSGEFYKSIFSSNADNDLINHGS